jgi:hypothetical protein
MITPPAGNRPAAASPRIPDRILARCPAAIRPPSNHTVAELRRLLQLLRAASITAYGGAAPYSPPGPCTNERDSRGPRRTEVLPARGTTRGRGRDDIGTSASYSQ